VIALDRLVGRHTADEVIAWARRLRHFQFMGDYSSGPVDCYEQLEMAIRFEGRKELLAILGAWGVLRYAPPELDDAWRKRDLRIVQDPSTVGDSYRQLLEPGAPDVLQPHECVIAGAPCWVDVSVSAITVTCRDADGVTPRTVEDATRIEAFIDAQGHAPRVVHGIATTPNCISAANFPEAFR